MRLPSTLVLCLAPFALAAYLGCGGEDVGDCPSNSDAQQAEGKAALSASCLACHSTANSGAARNGAPDGKNLDDIEYVRSDSDEIYSEVEGGDMPPGGALPAAQVEAIRVYLACGAK